MRTAGLKNPMAIGTRASRERRIVSLLIALKFLKAGCTAGGSSSVGTSAELFRSRRSFQIPAITRATLTPAITAQQMKITRAQEAANVIWAERFPVARVEETTAGANGSAAIATKVPNHIANRVREL